MTNLTKTLVFMLGLPLAVAGWEPPTFSLCDINQDGNTNVVDIQGEIDQVLHVLPSTNDLNGDGAVNLVDVEIEITAALGVACLAGPEMHSVGALPVSIENTTSVAPMGPQTYAIDAVPVSVENTTPVAPTGPQTYAVDAVPVSIENSAPVAATGPQTYAVDAIPVSIENTIPVAPTGPMTMAATGVPVSILNTTSPAAPPPLTYYVSGLKFSLFNGLTPTFLTAPMAASLRFRQPVDPTFLAEALARGAHRIDGRAVCLDTDGDGLCDADELIIGTSPYLADTDGDGYPDGLELALGSDPLDPHSIPDIRPPGYLATPPVSIQTIVPVAILTPRRQGVVHAADNQ